VAPAIHQKQNSLVSKKFFEVTLKKAFLNII
jgi:hypothetical protein